jgi:hypothetical protein
MSKFQEAVETYVGEMKKLGISGISEDLISAVAKGLGPSIYNTDSSKVSCSDDSELGRVKTNFLIKKLGLKDGPDLDAAIKEVCETMGSSNRNKYRAIFYALLVKKFGKESVYSSAS